MSLLVVRLKDPRKDAEHNRLEFDVEHLHIPNQIMFLLIDVVPPGARTGDA